jgi:hypothetical protein
MADGAPVGLVGTGGRISRVDTDAAAIVDKSEVSPAQCPDRGRLVALNAGSTGHSYSVVGARARRAYRTVGQLGTLENLTAWYRRTTPIRQLVT